MKDKKVILAYLSVCFFWGSTFLAMKIGVKDLPPFIFAAIRFLVAGAIMVLVGLFTKKKFPETMGEYLKIGFSGVLILMGGNGIVVYAEQWVHSGIASLLVTTIPLFMVFIESKILKQVKINWKGLVGFAISFVGVGFLTISGGEELSIDLFGVSLLLLASFFWAIGSVYSKNIKATSDIVPRIGIQMLGGFVGLIIMSQINGEPLLVSFTRNGFLALVYLIIFGSLVGYSSYIYVLDKWSAARAGTYAYVNPIVAVILGALILGEPITTNIVFSMVIIILGVIIVQRVGVETVTSSRDHGHNIGETT